MLKGPNLFRAARPIFVAWQQSLDTAPTPVILRAGAPSTAGPTIRRGNSPVGRVALPPCAHHDREPGRDLVALPAVKALCDDQNLFHPLGLKLIPGSPRHGSA